MKRAILAELFTACRDQKPAALVTVLASGQQTVVYPHTDPASTALAATTAHAAQEALRKDRSGVVETADGSLFIHVLAPPPRMLIVGAVHIAQALAPMADLAGYEVTVIDPRRAFATAERFPSCNLVTEWPERALPRLAPDRRTAIVTLTHDQKLDEPALRLALQSDAFYIGALGSKKTQAARRERLTHSGLNEHALVRIHGPAGLDVGAKTPAEIAISIMAEVTQALRQRRPAA
ncbi:MAG: XdhC family protein [Acidiferrobacterales bacterium]